MSVDVIEREAEAIATEEYIVGEPFDYSVEHSDTYYEQFMSSFEPNTKKRRFYRFMKRFFDIVSSFIGLVLLSPILLIIAIAIKLESRGPIIFKQQRMGKDGKLFNCYKFRSMRIDAPRNCPTAELENPNSYLTRVGRILRKTSLDELPQLWCVFIGTMSVIGYRPLVSNGVDAECNEMRERLGVLSMRPGISGYAQVLGRDAVYFKNKAILDALYVKDASLWFDIKLLFMTIAVVFNRKGNKDNAHKQSTTPAVESESIESSQDEIVV